jgi:hypothetical protein
VPARRDRGRFAPPPCAFPPLRARPRPAGNANFRAAEFTDDGIFRKVIFEKGYDAIFESVKFKNNGFFDSAIFNGDVYFSRTFFEGEAAFQEVNFLSGAYFCATG